MSFENIQLGSYLPLRLLGSGSVGEVYLAEDYHPTQKLTFKLMLIDPESYSNTSSIEEAIHRFQREMKAISLLDHPYILPVLDFGERQVEQTRIVYTVMPYCSEGSLVDWLQQRGGRLSSQEVVHIVSQAAEALQHAHEKGIVHQDVKPSNFLLHSRSASDVVSLPDLWLADFVNAKFRTIRTAGNGEGCSGQTYLAPEQWTGQPVPASDQYALGIMAYQLLTGQAPFQGEEEDMMGQHLSTWPEPPSHLNPSLNHAIDAVILRTLEKNPAERFVTIREFARALQQALHYAGDLQVIVPITAEEARTGSIQTILLPGNLPVNIWVMAGIQNGQVIQLCGLGEEHYEGGPRGAVFLTVSVSC